MCIVFCSGETIHFAGTYLLSFSFVHQVISMVISVTWCVSRRFYGAWALFSHPLVLCSWGTMSTAGRTESRYVLFDKMKIRLSVGKPNKTLGTNLNGLKSLES